jgi:hypothetical protein
MSAWYVLSSMGIYQVTPGSDIGKQISNLLWEIITEENVTKLSSQNLKKLIFLQQESREIVADFSSIILSFQQKSKSFQDKMVEILSKNPTDKIYYWLMEILMQ